MNIKNIEPETNPNNLQIRELNAFTEKIKAKEALLMDTCFTISHIVERISKHLFKRKSEQYNPSEKLENFKNLMAFAGSNRLIYVIVVGDYFKKYAHSHIQKVLSNQCINFQYPKDTVKIWIIVKKLQDNTSPYWDLLYNTFIAKFKDYLENPDRDLAEQTFDGTIKTFHVIKNVENKLFIWMNCILSKSVIDVLDLVENEPVFAAIHKLANNKCLDGHNDIVIQIVEKMLELMHHDQWEVIVYALSTINNLVFSNKLVNPERLQNLEAKSIQQISTHLTVLLDHPQWEVVANASATIYELVKVGMLQNLEAKSIQQISTYLTVLLDHTQQEVVANALVTICELVKVGMLQNLEAKSIQQICVKLIEFLKKDQVIVTIFIFLKLAETGVLKRIDLEVIKKIYLKTKKLADKALLDKNQQLIFIAVKMLLILTPLITLNEEEMEQLIGKIQNDYNNHVNVGYIKT